MSETLLVRTAGGNWEKLSTQDSIPEGDIVDVFGSELSPILHTDTPVIVVAASPHLGAGRPAGLGVDTLGGVWVLELDLSGDGATTLPNLITFGGSLTGMSYEDFNTLCNACEGNSLFEHVSKYAEKLNKQDFQESVTSSLSSGRINLISIVKQANQTLVSSMRFLNATGATGAIYEATSFRSPSISAIQATKLDLNTEPKALPAPAKKEAPTPVQEEVVDEDFFATKSTSDTAPEKSKPKPELKEPEPEVKEPVLKEAVAEEVAPEKTAKSSGSNFNQNTLKATNESTAKLMQLLQDALEKELDTVTYDASSTQLEAFLTDSDNSDALFVSAESNGNLVVFFASLNNLDPKWRARTELCQGMERLLGTDLGDVEKISQLNLSISEHLMDASLMEALIDLLADAAQDVRGPQTAAA